MLRDNPKVLTQPISEPVTLTEAKNFLRVDNTTDDSYITDLITTARVAIENVLNRTLFTTTLTLTKPYFPNGSFQTKNVDTDFNTSFNSVYEAESEFYDISPSDIYLPKGFVVSVSSVKYTDDSGIETVFPSSNYFLNRQERLSLSSGNGWIGNGNISFVEIEYIAGWSNVSDIPKPIKNAILVLIANMYNSRGCSCDIPRSMSVMLKPYTLPYYVRPKTISVQRG